MAIAMHRATDAIDDCSGMNYKSTEKEKHQSKVARRTALMVFGKKEQREKKKRQIEISDNEEHEDRPSASEEVMFDSEEDDRTDINEIVHEALIRSKHPRNCKLKGRAVYTGSSDDSPMITDDDCLSSVYDPDDDNRRTDDDDEDEFQSIENDEENLSTSSSKLANIFKKVVKNACSSTSDSEDDGDIEEQVKPTETPSEKEEGQKLHEGPQLLRSHGARGQVKVDKSQKSGTTPNMSISTSRAHMCMFCEKQFQKLTRHQRRRHKEEPYSRHNRWIRRILLGRRRRSQSKCVIR
ncbi:uncharacterized protein [Acropora muricata]|uniref:uncharacterized protein n=1 Tax=Acropora muricata TaxID=159855 RepID=UPI0034E4B871